MELNDHHTALTTYEINHRVLTNAGLSVASARDLMSVLTIVRLGFGTYTAYISEDTVVIHIQSEQGHACSQAVLLAKPWIETSPIEHKEININGDTRKIFSITYRINIASVP